MTTIPKELTVYESPKSLALGEVRVFTIDFADLGTPDAAGSTTAYSSTGTDVSSTMLSGSNGLLGTQVSLETFTPASAGWYRLICDIAIGGKAAKGIVDVSVLPVIPVTVSTGSNSYGSPAGVARLVPKFANKSGSFDDTTRPSLSQIVTMIDQVSSQMNITLSTYGFTVPITAVLVLPAITLFVEEMVAKYVQSVNVGTNRGPQNKSGTGSTNIISVINKEIIDFIETNKIGLEAAGADRPTDLGSGIAYRDGDDDGNEVSPLFTREGLKVISDD